MELKQSLRILLDFLDTPVCPTFVLNVLPYNGFGLSQEEFSDTKDWDK